MEETSMLKTAARKRTCRQHSLGTQAKQAVGELGKIRKKKDEKEQVGQLVMAHT